MELSWSTFALEIINFLILVWILKRFFYRPILEVIERRRAGIAKSLANAEAVRAQAENLHRQYESRLADWERERQKARDALASELESERADRLAEVENALSQEREKATVAEARRHADAQRKIEAAALLQAAKFASRLLAQASGPELEQRLLDMVTEALSRLSDDRMAKIRSSVGPAADVVLVTSAHPLTEDRRVELEAALEKLVAAETPIRFEQNVELLAGVSIAVGAWVLGANVRDELEGFAGLASDV